ncbi:unnamed protein product [Eruca vesicaria subsp. sativa]|uniref:DC1 domain-containing protein n=1 Tax=Eruca vesicaria subsp. sativa TaxID=29727 RepID=A0ABC8JV71_ERUVS|nr:unnamed protein product [Eruca vesicaria subsp. sativa]
MITLRKLSSCQPLPLRSSVYDQMEPEGVSLPWIHSHRLMPWNDLRRGDCCRLFESQSDGYYCKLCDLFVHKKCCDELSEFIDHPSHAYPIHSLMLQKERDLCFLCGRKNVSIHHRCQICNFEVDLLCAKYPPPDVLENVKMHGHKLTLVKELTGFDCSAKCGKTDKGFPYKCEECEDVAFHVDCVWHPTAEVKQQLEVDHSYHPLHLLNLFTGPPPDYSDGKCCLCGREVDEEFFYHCSSCNFTLRCVLHPPQQTIVDLNAHDHPLSLLPRLDSFKCNACGLTGDRSPYICVPCGFMIHQDCLLLPRVININRHDHRVSRTSVLGEGAMNSVCGVCRKKVDWTRGGFSCQRCLGYVVHSNCATNKDVWNGKELEGLLEEEEDTKPYLVIDDNTIQHFSHKEHHLKLHMNGIRYEESKRCRACNHPIGLQSFYGCMKCNFSLHKKCAECPKRKWHVLHNDRLTLVINEEENVFNCDACEMDSNGFMYKHGDTKLDVLCGSVLEPFVHPSHPHHPLYHIPTEKEEICNGCNSWETHILRCIEGDCGFILGFECATLPQVVKHIAYNHPLSLCYGEEEVIGKYWCDICEKEVNPKEWFYTCKDHLASLHTNCVLGSFSGLMPRSIAKFLWKSYEVVLNNSVTRPFCSEFEVKWAEATDKIFLTVVLADS